MFENEWVDIGLLDDYDGWMMIGVWLKMEMIDRRDINEKREWMIVWNILEFDKIIELFLCLIIGIK